MPEKQALFSEMDRHLREDEKPSLFFKSLEEKELTEFPFSMLERLKETEQSKVYHPEGSVWNHTMLVVDEAAKVKKKSGDARAFLWAALLHDIGKPDTTKLRGGRITAYDHDKVGAPLAKRFLKEFSEDERWIEAVCALVRWHMQILYVAKSPSFAEIEKMKRQTDIRDVALLGLCDRLGRLGADREKEEDAVAAFLQFADKKLV